MLPLRPGFTNSRSITNTFGGISTPLLDISWATMAPPHRSTPKPAHTPANVFILHLAFSHDGERSRRTTTATAPQSDRTDGPELLFGGGNYARSLVQLCKSAYCHAIFFSSDDRKTTERLRDREGHQPLR